MTEDILNIPERGEREEKRESYNKYNNIIYPKSIINKSQIIKSTSFKPQDFQLLHDFEAKALLERPTYQDKTGWSFLVKKAMREYLQRHPLPNPQVTLERSLNLNMPAKPTNVCCVPGCRGKTAFILRLKNFENQIEPFQVCWRHRKWKHKDYRWLVAKKPMNELKK